jgi:hypothetical protein
VTLFNAAPPAGVAEPDRVDWVIVGGESRNAKRREMDLGWLTRVVGLCQAARPRLRQQDSDLTRALGPRALDVGPGRRRQGPGRPPTSVLARGSTWSVHTGCRPGRRADRALAGPPLPVEPGPDPSCESLAGRAVRQVRARPLPALRGRVVPLTHHGLAAVIVAGHYHRHYFGICRFGICRPDVHH